MTKAAHGAGNGDGVVAIVPRSHTTVQEAEAKMGLLPTVAQ